MSATAATIQRARTGLYPGLSRAEYESIDAINASILEHFERSAAHARAAMLHPRQPTEAMNFGTAMHCAILEPQRFVRGYAVPPKCDRRTKEGKQAWAEWEAEHRDVEPIEANLFNDLQRMRDAAWSHPIASQLLGGRGHNEVGVVFEATVDPLDSSEPVTLLGKSLIDRLGEFDGYTWITDLKSTLDASRRAFATQIKKLHYGPKAAYYVDGCNAVAPRPRRFAWIAVEKAPPYAVAVYEADESALSAGRAKYMRWLRLYEEAKRTGIWAGYPLEVQPMSSIETEW